jgi:dephospho-CoA kinase
MMKVGLTGSIAMGKSEIAKIFAAQSIPVFDSDREVHALYDSADGATLLQDIAPEAVHANRVDRKRLAACVLADQSLLPKIEKRVHTEISRRREDFWLACRSSGERLALVDIPLLFEKGYEKDLDLTLVVSAPEHIQRARALARPGMTAEKLAMILARQMPDSEKRARADIIIENDGTLEDLRQRTEAVISQLRKKVEN